MQHLRAVGLCLSVGVCLQVGEYWSVGGGRSGGVELSSSSADGRRQREVTCPLRENTWSEEHDDLCMSECSLERC